MRLLSIKRSRGQGMTEYIIIVALIAIAAIGVYTMFGNVVKSQTGSMAAALAGDNGTAVTANKDAKDKIDSEKITKNKNLNDYATNNEIKGGN